MRPEAAAKGDADSSADKDLVTRVAETTGRVAAVITGAFKTLTGSGKKRSR
ncbi:MAG: hypothetical protein H0U81_13990 [Pyrinomonadaceae bacterium]|nr:hypothetical protein [Pyrinomonadaceae bacterium]